MPVQDSIPASGLRADFRDTLRLALPLIFAELGWMTMALSMSSWSGDYPTVRLPLARRDWARAFTTASPSSGWPAAGHGHLRSAGFRPGGLGGRPTDTGQRTFPGVYPGTLLMLVVLSWAPLMRYFGISTELVAPMSPFLRALNWGTMPLLVYFALRRYLQAVNVVHPSCLRDFRESRERVRELGSDLRASRLFPNGNHGIRLVDVLFSHLSGLRARDHPLRR